MKTPDLTPAQLLAALALILGELVANGLVTNGQEKLVLSIASAVVPLCWMLADAIIRHGRSRALAGAQLPPVPSTPSTLPPPPPPGV